MKQNQKEVRCLVFLFLLLPMLATGCAGINERQLMADQVIFESNVVVKRADINKAEFDQLVAEYEDTREESSLQRMHTLIDLMQTDVTLAGAFFRQQKYYPKGISLERWQACRHAHELTRKHLCEMILATAELELVYADKEKAGILLDRLLKNFPEEEYAGYRMEARNRAAELSNAAEARAACAAIEKEDAQ